MAFELRIETQLYVISESMLLTVLLLITYKWIILLREKGRVLDVEHKTSHNYWEDILKTWISRAESLEHSVSIKCALKKKVEINKQVHHLM